MDEAQPAMRGRNRRDERIGMSILVGLAETGQKESDSEKRKRRQPGA